MTKWENRQQNSERRLRHARWENDPRRGWTPSFPEMVATLMIVVILAICLVSL